MKYRMHMSPVEKEGSQIKGYGTLKIGEDITIKNLSLVANGKGKLFLSTPNRRTNRMDRNGKPVYEDICFPITGEMRKQMQIAAISSLEEKKSIEFSDESYGSLLVTVTPFDAPYYNRVGRASLTINDCLVIQDVFINQKQDGSLYVTLPNYKTNQKTQDGKDLYAEIVVLSGGMKKTICDEVVSEYRLAMEDREKNRLAIQGRLKAAKNQSMMQETKSVKQQENVRS